MKPDLRRLLWPIFVHSYLNLVSEFYPKEAKAFFGNFRDHFADEHEQDLRRLQSIQLPEHVADDELAKIYRSQRYRVTLSQIAFYNLVQFLESKDTEGGAVIISIIQTNLNVVTVERSADDQYSLAKLLDRSKNVENFPAEDEGIPGHNPGSANVDRNAGSTVLTRLKLGRNILDHDGRQDVLAELEAEDNRNPPSTGQTSLVDHFEQRIKREESEDAPTRTEVPLPPPLARDVAMEVQKVKENRDRFKIEGRTGGIGPGLSVVMYTFHSTNDRYIANLAFVQSCETNQRGQYYLPRFFRRLSPSCCRYRSALHPRLGHRRQGTICRTWLSGGTTVRLSSSYRSLRARLCCLFCSIFKFVGCGCLNSLQVPTFFICR